MLKRIISIAALAALLLSLALLPGCAEETVENPEQPENEETVQPDTESGFTYSDGLDDNGFFAGMTALDYVELFDYNAFAIPAEIHTVSDDVIREEIDSILESYPAETKITDRAVAAGETVNIDYVGSIDGVEFSGGSTNGMGTSVIIGVTSYIDDFLEQLIGHMPGETFDVNVTFPEDYGVEELNGKDAVFVTTINYISETSLSELNDDFVYSNFNAQYGWSTVADLQNAINENYQSAAVNEYIQDYLVNSVKISEIPDAMLTYQENSLIKYYEEGAAYYGLTFDEFIAEYAGVATRDELISANTDANAEAARYYMVMQAIAEDMGLTISNEDVADYFMNNFYTADYSMYEQEYGLPYLKYSVLCQKVIDHITANVVLQ